MSFKAYQSNVVHDLFVRTADENYITARWCAVNELNTDFFWLAVHALEKYMKATLLLNKCSSKGCSHNIIKLYLKVKNISGSLLPELLEQPQNLQIDYWPIRTPEAFLELLYNNGNADNRYLIFGIVKETVYLHLLDRMVFVLRRLVCRLDDQYLPSSIKNAPTFTQRDLLKRNPKYYDPINMPLDLLIESKKVSAARTAALNLNMEFAPAGFPHEDIPDGWAARNPVIRRSILDPLRSDNQMLAEEAIRLAEWFLENVQVPGKAKDPGVRQEIEEEVEKAKERFRPTPLK